MATNSAAQPLGAATAGDLAQVLLDVSLTGFILFRPLYAAPGGLIQDLAYEHLNPAAQQMLGLPERPADTFLTLYPASQETGIFTFYAAAFASGQTERYQSNYQHDGLDGYFYLVARRHGELLVVSFTDTNDQPRSAVEEALRQSQAREQQALAETQRQRAELQRLFAQSPVAMSLLRGPDLLIEMANARMGQIWGRPVEQVLGRPHFEALPDLAGQGFEQVLATVRATGQPYVQPEQPITIAHPEQPYHGYLNITYLPEGDAHGQPTGILIYVSDVTEQVLARQQVQQLNQELEARVQQRTEELAATNEELHRSNTRLTHINADLDNFVYTASHDLKSPISNIEGLLALLPELLPAAVRTDEQVASVLARMQESAERFRRTIGHLTDVSRLQAEFAQPAESVRLADVVEDVRQDLLPQLTQAQAQLEVAVDESWPQVFSEKNLRSVVYNLLSNALKYHHPDRPPRVRIACVPTGNQLVLTVQDNGLGLSEQQQTRLFQLFQRLHTHVEGTGVGLYMVKRIVEQAGGGITVQSQEGVGTTFVLVFPA